MSGVSGLVAGDLILIMAAILAVCLIAFLYLARRAPLDDSEREAYRRGEGYVSRPLPRRAA
ncbi:hypothetical protein NOCA2770005 [metagenome]|uniref:Uncharacterized protein n=1 Tax=metagenome TaxID=256318 RepID=A0A2P2CHE5_9ZZZZ